MSKDIKEAGLNIESKKKLIHRLNRINQDSRVALLNRFMHMQTIYI